MLVSGVFDVGVGGDLQGSFDFALGVCDKICLKWVKSKKKYKSRILLLPFTRGFCIIDKE